MQRDVGHACFVVSIECTASGIIAQKLGNGNIVVQVTIQRLGLRPVASEDLWIMHYFFGLPGSLNDINVCHQSHLFAKLVWRSSCLQLKSYES
jgi:hypothetical protein